jgi:hypothetical protein
MFWVLGMLLPAAFEKRNPQFKLNFAYADITACCAVSIRSSPQIQ